MNKEWMPVDTMPEGVLVETKIEDAHGVRNVQRLIKRTREPGRTRPMFFVEGEATYVYYQPTHWRPISASEAPKNGTRKEISPAAQAMIELFYCGWNIDRLSRPARHHYLVQFYILDLDRIFADMLDCLSIYRKDLNPAAIRWADHIKATN